MNENTGVLRERIAALAELNSTWDRTVAALLDTALELEAGDHASAEELFAAAKVIGESEQARHGQLVRLLAQADRVNGRKGVLKPWIATQLDVTDSSAPVEVLPPRGRQRNKQLRIGIT